jgi:hypothetical protein
MRRNPPHTRRSVSGLPRIPRAAALFSALAPAEPELAASERRPRCAISRKRQVSRPQEERCHGARRCRHRRGSRRDRAASTIEGSLLFVPTPGGCPSPVRFGARPPQRRCRRRTRLDSPGPRRRHGSETSSMPRCPPSSRGSPPAEPSLTRGSRPTPEELPARGSGSGRERPSPRSGSHRMPRCTLALDVRRSGRPPHQHECWPDWNERVGSRGPEGPSPNATPTDMRRNSRRTNALPTTKGRRRCHRR